MKKLIGIILLSIFIVSCGLINLNSDAAVTIVVNNSNRGVIPGITSIVLTVEGPGMNKKVIESATSSLSFNIKPGSDRVFTLDVELESGIKYHGTATADIASGNVTVTIPVSISSIPSFGHYSFSVTKAETENGPGIGSEMALTIIDNKISFLYRLKATESFDLISDSIEVKVTDTGDVKTFIFPIGESSVKFILTFDTANSGTFTIEDNSGVTEFYYKSSGTFEARDSSNIADILDFKLSGSSATIIGNNINVSLPVGTNPEALSSLTPTITISPGATISPLPSAAQNFTSPVTYTVTAQDGTTKNYTATINVSFSVVTDTTIPVSYLKFFSVFDYNHDGNQDLISYVDKNNLRVYNQATLGGFSLSSTLSTNNKDIYGMGFGDLDNDNYPEIITAGPNGATDSHNAVYLNTSGTFATGSTTNDSNSVSFYGNGAISGDVDSNGYSDAIWLTGNSVYVGLRNNSSTFSSIIEYSGSQGGSSLSEAGCFDIDGDGDLDILSARAYNGDGDGSLDLFINDGTGVFSVFQIIKSAYSSDFTGFLSPYGTTISDVNNDGKLDLIFYNNTTTSTEKGLWIGLRISADGSSPVYSFSKVDNAILNISPGYFVDSGDFNSDGNQDLLVSHGSGLMLFVGDGSGSFVSYVISDTQVDKAIFKDINNDGKLDIVGVMSSTIQIWYQ